MTHFTNPMKKTFHYQIPDTFLIMRSDNPLPSPFFVLRDKKIPKHTNLEKMFGDAHKIFRVRIRDLGNLDMPTTNQDAGEMQVMLDGLIRAKRQIHKERGE